MIIHVGSQNEVKVEAVRQAVALYPAFFPNPEVRGIDVNVDLFGQPKTIAETVEGAIQRARRAYDGAEFSIGLESGLMAVPETKSGMMDVCAAAIFDGKEVAIGLSPAFEFPKAVTELVMQGDVDASQAMHQLNLTDVEKLGANPGGIIGFLTAGRFPREEQTKQAIMMAMIQLESPNLYA